MRWAAGWLLVRHNIMTLLIACTSLLCAAAALQEQTLAVPNAGVSLLCGDQCWGMRQQPELVSGQVWKKLLP